jgi:SAM-dependent methyltransferase
VDKLARVWPGYVDVWRSLAGLELDGADAWIHRGGWTPFPSFANHLVTGKAGVVTIGDERVLDRYLVPAVNGAIGCELAGVADLTARRRALEPLRWAPSALAAIEALGGALIDASDTAHIPLANGSVDLCHSGGVLEHHHPEQVRSLLAESRRILRPGGVLSHVVDHRDHLHHADPGWPFLAHLRLSPEAYRALLGHPLLHHNRLLPAEVAALFEEAGFERIAVRRMLLPSGRWVDTETEALAGTAGIERDRLARAFRRASEADLRTAAAHYLFRNPAG